MNMLECVKGGLFYLDGAMGTYLQGIGLKPGELPETWNLTHPGEITALLRAYYEAGSHAVLTNTLGLNGLKFDGKGGRPSVREIAFAAAACARKARETAVGGQADQFIGLDVGPLGRLLRPWATCRSRRRYRFLPKSCGRGRKPGWISCTSRR